MSLACLRRAVRGRPNAATARLTLATLDGEPLASLRAPSLEDLSSTLRPHPLTEAVRLLPSARVWLERPPHRETLFFLRLPRPPNSPLFPYTIRSRLRH